ncbi:MAG TPA: hypothetical protein EYM95_08985, partial [Candidatus Obscuribacterales bacterium]|nr:hypothetical protein [Candidatus Obscuribacterales bacterium]
MTKRRSITCSLAVPLTALLISIQPTLSASAAASPSSKVQLDNIEKRIEKDELGDDVYAQLDAIIQREPTNYRAHLYLG